MHNLIEVKRLCPRIAFDIVYATDANFTGKAVYPSPHCFLLKTTAERLARVQHRLEKIGLGLKVYDGYRPHSVSKKFWEFLPDPRYVANPIEGSRHNRGAAVDLTLIDGEGRELPMPTGFDDFSEKAHRNSMGLSTEAICNRQILEDAMEAEGFVPFAYEWWHFDDPEWKNFPILDLTFEELLRSSQSRL